tara:strand:- start:920 stop:1345 length:426 start_codon:yes stop_codon:yes gene_type:complete
MTEKIVKDFLNKCSIVFDDFEQLDGMNIPRDVLLSDIKYEEVKNDIEKIKNIYSSGSLTSLHKNAKENQKWPLLNLVRQILKSNNYKMDPIRKSNGYTKEGKKKYLRFFVIKKIKSKQDIKKVTEEVTEEVTQEVTDKILI